MRSRSSTRRPTATRPACSRAADRRAQVPLRSAGRQHRHQRRRGRRRWPYFPFSGWKESFFGDLHAQGRDAIDFYTEKKVVVERWPATWSRKF
jgi:hypothetical protein